MSLFILQIVQKFAEAIRDALTRSTFSFLQNTDHALPFPHTQIAAQRLHLLRHHLSSVLYLSATHKHSIFEAPPFDYIFNPKEYSSKTFFSLTTSSLPNADLWVSPRKKTCNTQIVRELIWSASFFFFVSFAELGLKEQNQDAVDVLFWFKFVKAFLLSFSLHVVWGQIFAFSVLFLKF